MGLDSIGQFIGRLNGLFMLVWNNFEKYFTMAFNDYFGA